MGINNTFNPVDYGGTNNALGNATAGTSGTFSTGNV